MKFSEAKRELDFRIYWLTTTEFEKEVAASFPILSLFKSGINWQMHEFMRPLELASQLTFVRGMVKQWYPNIAKELGEPLAEEESDLLEQFDAEFRGRPSQLEAEIAGRKKAGEKVRFASKSKLRKAMVEKFVGAFGSQCGKMETGPEWDPLFYMKCCGWLVGTQLWFGRQQSLISHRHWIESETRIQHSQNPEITGPAMKLTPGIVWPSSRDLECLLDSDVDWACNATIKHCIYFFEAAPKLLKGLEFDKIEAG